jgi:hypothetical protein
VGAGRQPDGDFVESKIRHWAGLPASKYGKDHDALCLVDPVGQQQVLGADVGDLLPGGASAQPLQQRRIPCQIAEQLGQGTLAWCGQVGHDLADVLVVDDPVAWGAHSGVGNPRSSSASSRVKGPR